MYTIFSDLQKLHQVKWSNYEGCGSCLSIYRDFDAKNKRLHKHYQQLNGFYINYIIGE